MEYRFSPRRLVLALATVMTAFVSLASVPARTPLPPDSLLRRWAANMLMVGFKGDSVTPDCEAAGYVRDLHIGAIVLFDVDLTGEGTIGSRNITSKDRLARMTARLQEWSDQPLIIALDQEGGRVARLKPQYGFSPTVQAEYLGTLDCEDTTRMYAARMAREMKECGVNLNLAPDVDLLYADNPVIAGSHRAFSPLPEVTARNAGWFADEHHKAGAAVTLKHFPGHGSSTGDTHYGLVDVTDTWHEQDLEPFRLLIDSGRADAIMTAHIYNRNIDPQYPATLSKRTIRDLLRDRLGYDGVVITDDIYMKGIIDEYGVEDALVLAINAGADMICAGNNGNGEFDYGRPYRLVDIIVQAVKDGRIPVWRLAESNRRIDALRHRIN